MTPDYQSVPAPKSSKVMIWIGRVLSALCVLLLLFSGYMKVTRNPAAVEGFKAFGFPDGVLVTIGIVEIACALIYAIPQTSVLGAILLAGYLGGATATHVRAGDGQFFGPPIIGAVLWLGLFLRDARVRALIPLKRK